MAKSLNQCSFIGNLGKDVEIKYTPGGDAVAKFSLACGESYKNKNGEKVDKTEWINIVVWRKLAEICGEYLKKGSKVYISGKMQTRKWQDKNGQDHWSTEIVANEMLMLDSRGDNQSGAHQSRPESDNNQSRPAPANSDFDDDIPF